jgi:hypothetical protein
MFRRPQYHSLNVSQEDISMKYIMPLMFLTSLFFSMETIAGQLTCDLKISKTKQAENTRRNSSKNH